MFVHQSSKLKQSNKTHNSKFNTKGAIKKKTKGKIADEQPRLNIKQSSIVGSKADRKNTAKTKRQQIMQANRLSHQEPPKVIGVFSLSSSTPAKKIYDSILSATDNLQPASSEFSATVFIPQSKQRLTMLVPPSNDAHLHMIDIMKVADVAVVAMDVNQGIDALGEKTISLLKSQGQPAILGVITGLNSIPMKNRNQVKKNLIKALHDKFPSEPKVLPLDLDITMGETSQELQQVVRFLGVTSAPIHQWRERRGFVIADQVKFQPNADSAEVGTLQVSGYLRGGNMNVNNLVHIMDWGDFQLKQIDATTDPYTRRKESMESEDHLTILATADPNLQESLESENTPDPLANEQTWPTEEELKEAEEAFNKKVQGDSKKKKRVPKGTSSYQAAWIVDSDEEDMEDGEEEAEDEDQMNDETSGKAEIEPEEKNFEGEEPQEWEEIDDEADNAAKEFDDAMEGEEFKKEEEDEELHFPDEVITPEDKAARIRFQKYRGLKSFRSSAWDPKENLPFDYAKIFQFQNFYKTKKRVLRFDKLAIPSGQYVTLHIQNVPRSSYDNRDASLPLLVSGLLQYENKTSVLHFNISKHHSYTEPVKSKDNLVFSCGFRRYRVQPIFSQNNVNCSKHKFERFLLPGRNTVASIYGPITFPSLPVLVMNEECSEIVATGNLFNVDPDRIILKKIILTGRPFKMHKRVVTVRGMFYNAPDIAWFKPVELWTKQGRSGVIKESLGTHGYMKCLFDGTVYSNDIVCMNLYKRVYPVWPKKKEETDQEKMN